MKLFNLFQFIVSMCIFLSGVMIWLDGLDKFVALCYILSGSLYFIHIYSMSMKIKRNK